MIAVGVLSYDPSGDPGHDVSRQDRPNHDGIGADHGTISNGDVTEDPCAGRDKHVIADPRYIVLPAPPADGHAR